MAKRSVAIGVTLSEGRKMEQEKMVFDSLMGTSSKQPLSKDHWLVWPHYMYYTCVLSLVVQIEHVYVLKPKGKFSEYATFVTCS